VKQNSPIHRMPGIIPGRPIPKAPRRIPWRMGLLLLLLGAGLWAYWYIFWSPAFSVTSVEVIGIQDQVIAPVTSSIYEKNIFRLKTLSIEQDIRNIYPPVEKVTIVRGLPHVIRLHIELRDPALRWYRGDAVFIVDTSGIVFDAEEKEEYVSLPKVLDYSGQSISIGQRLVSTTFLQIIRDVPTKIQNRFGLPLETIEVTEITFHIDILVSGGMRLRITTQRPLDEQLESAELILKNHPEAKYIDVRVVKRAYWKP
jgi:hypothetical protein